MYRPLIYTSCYGNQYYFDCLSLMLRSLYVFGRYRGAILILTDRAEIAVPDEMLDMVRVLCCDAIGWSTRYQIQDFIGACDAPVLYADSDMIITQDVNPILRKLSNGIYVCSELSLRPQLANIPVSAIKNKTIQDKITQWYGNWYGLDLFLGDAELRDRPLQCLNSGFFGYSERRIFERHGRQMRDMHMSNTSIPSFYTDQPFFNYVLAKVEIDSELLNGALSLVATADDAVKFQKPFVHFCWARDDEKARQMSQYMKVICDV